MAEVPNPSRRWRKSSVSGATECVEIAPDAAGVLIRDSKRPEGGLIPVATGAWTALIGDIKTGRITPA
ncbi:DUF397 domain-containing protein [Actinomadura rayongensis]|uniref:DUF397 domain-containing protein n=1 Tax=Actinomadura rayongensis TaxID=1429076 RepID=A0A6I4WFA1_9ACTN|nr:DUF397 domain-containing protein [Actinomadura rayongensis]MXQ66536.1 DUF397 domain-containing protein [Actinomadura rayongensis]